MYAWGGDQVVKVPNAGVPEAWLVEELRIADSAVRSGAPIPAVDGMVMVADRHSMVSRRIDGPSMGRAFRDDPDRADEFGRELARIQVETWACVPSYELPLQRDRVEAKVYAAAREFGDDLLVALDLIPTEQRPLALCHGDLHPSNVVLGSGGPVLVDWFDASRGTPDADCARTEVMLTDADVDLGVGGDRVWRLVESYRAAIESTGCCDREHVARWAIVQRVGRLAEGFGVADLDALRRDLAAFR